MMIRFLEVLLHWNEEEEALDAKYEPLRDQLRLAGLSEEKLREMAPDERVAALEQRDLRFVLRRVFLALQGDNGRTQFMERGIDLPPGFRKFLFGVFHHHREPPS